MLDPVNPDSPKARFDRSVEDIGRSARRGSAQVAEGIGALKSGAISAIEKLNTKAPDPYVEAIADYNGAFTLMNDKGLSLFRERERSTDLIELVELLVNSIANTPKAYATDFDEIKVNRANFLEAEAFAKADLEAARNSAAGAGAGFAAGAAVASMAPTAAVWAAATFGTASTGTAISTLSGAAATQASLAWLGGGALASGGGGTAAGTALLALAGPIGWTVAGATLLTSIALFAKKKYDNREAKQKALTAVKQNIGLVNATAVQIDDLLQRSTSLRVLLKERYGESLSLFGADFRTLPPSQQTQLAALVNSTKASAALLGTHVTQVAVDG